MNLPVEGGKTWRRILHKLALKETLLLINGNFERNLSRRRELFILMLSHSSREELRLEEGKITN